MQELQDYVAMLFLNVLWSGCVVFPLTQLYPFYNPPLITQGFHFFLHFSPSLFPLLLSVFLPSFLLACHDSNMLMGVGRFLLMLWVSLVIRDVEHLCMFPLGI